MSGRPVAVFLKMMSSFRVEWSCIYLHQHSSSDPTRNMPTVKMSAYSAALIF